MMVGANSNLLGRNVPKKLISCSLGRHACNIGFPVCLCLAGAVQKGTLDRGILGVRGWARAQICLAGAPQELRSMLLGLKPGCSVGFPFCMSCWGGLLVVGAFSNLLGKSIHRSCVHVPWAEISAWQEQCKRMQKSTLHRA